MIVGTTIIHDGTGTTPYYSPTFPRGGLAAVFSLNVTHMAGSPDLDIDIEHKNADETTWSTVDSFSTITAVGVATKNVSGTGIKEQLRFKFTFSAGSAGDFMHMIVASPAWRPYT